MNLVNTAAALAPLLGGWRTATWLALDTEFVRETTYYPKPCVLQIGDGKTSICVDLIALTRAELQPLFDLLAAPGIVKVFHSASQDLELFVQITGDCPRPLFDTQIAATLLGEGDQLGYGALVEKKLGVKLDKSLTRTDWSRRPLSVAELSYAADDVRYLAELYPLLRDALIARGRLPWLEEDCARLTEAARYVTKPADAWKRLKGISRLDPAARAAAAALAGWREVEAQQRDRPRKWILEDDAIYRIAERRPDSAAALAALHALPAKTLEKHSTAILEIVAESRELAAPDVTLFAGLEGIEKARFTRLQALTRDRALELGIPAPTLASRGDLEVLARNPEASDLLPLNGWRREQIGVHLNSAAV